MPTSKKSAAKKSASKNGSKARSKKRTPGKGSQPYKRSVQPLNLSKAIEQPTPSAQQVFNNLSEPSETAPISINQDQTQADIQEYLDYKSVNPLAHQSKSFAIYMTYKQRGMLLPILTNEESFMPPVQTPGNGQLDWTSSQYLVVMDQCKKTFAHKLVDYGASWRIFRMPAIADQIFIKANRIRTIQEACGQMIDDSIQSEYVGIINYAIMAMIQLQLSPTVKEEKDLEVVGTLFDNFATVCFETMQKKNHDYGESWKYMQVETFCDMILVRLKRIQQILANKGDVKVSEPLDQNFIDIVNYAIFALIRYNDKTVS